MQFSKHNQRDRDNDRDSRSRAGQQPPSGLPSGLSGINTDLTTVQNPQFGSSSQARYCIDDFSQLSGQRPSCSLIRSSEVEALVTRRKRLETIHPYERSLLLYPADSRDFPPPPPEFLRLVRDRAEIKTQLLLHQAEKDNKLSLLSRDDGDEYGFNANARSRSPYQSRTTEPFREPYRDTFTSSRDTFSEPNRYSNVKYNPSTYDRPDSASYSSRNNFDSGRFWYR